MNSYKFICKNSGEQTYLNQNNKKTVSDFDIVASLEQDIITKQKRLDNLVSNFANLDPDSAKARAFSVNIDKLSDEIDDLTEKIKSEREKRNIKRKIEKTQSVVNNIATAWPHMTDEEKRTVCREVIERITVKHREGQKPKIKLEFRFAKHLKQKEEK